MTFDCDSWMELSDRVALGEVVSDRELEFLRSHGASCRWCGREVAVFRELSPSTLHAVPNTQEVEKVLREAAPLLNTNFGEERLPVEHTTPSVEGVRARIRARPRVLVLTAAALVASAAMLVLFLRDPAMRGAGVSSPARSAAKANANAAAKASGTPADTLMAKSNEDTCGLLVAGIVLCLTRGSEVGKVELSTPERVVHLERGRAVAMLEPQPTGTSFSISTRAGKVTAVGTVFSVEVLADGGAVARVSRGKVLVRSNGQTPDQALLAGQSVRLGQIGGSRLSEAERTQDLALIESLLPGQSDQGADERGGTLDSELGRQKGSDANDALARARALRARGEFARAAQVYREIHARDPRGSSGRAALVSLGSLLLSSLDDAPSALVAFNRYLSGGPGPLTQQAEYGRIRALRALGRTGEERAAIDVFIARYPSAPETRHLKQAGDGRP